MSDITPSSSVAGAHINNLSVGQQQSELQSKDGIKIIDDPMPADREISTKEKVAFNEGKVLLDTSTVISAADNPEIPGAPEPVETIPKVFQIFMTTGGDYYADSARRKTGDCLIPFPSRNMFDTLVAAYYHEHIGPSGSVPGALIRTAIIHEGNGENSQYTNTGVAP